MIDLKAELKRNLEFTKELEKKYEALEFRVKNEFDRGYGEGHKFLQREYEERYNKGFNAGRDSVNVYMENIRAKAYEEGYNEGVAAGIKIGTRDKLMRGTTSQTE